MGYAELVHQRLQTLPQEKQAEVYDFVEFIATRNIVTEALDEDQHKKRVLAALASARGAWPKTGEAQIGRMAADMRAEWEGRGWENRR
ncbi:MAG: hypothetical protein WC091_04365 [Sulfuricellaceae bacterium]